MLTRYGETSCIQCGHYPEAALPVDIALTMENDKQQQRQSRPRRDGRRL